MCLSEPFPHFWDWLVLYSLCSLSFSKQFNIFGSITLFPWQQRKLVARSLSIVGKYQAGEYPFLSPVTRGLRQRVQAELNCGHQWQVAFLRGRYWDRHCLTSLSAMWIVGLSAPSASLPTTPSCVVRQTHWREAMTSRRTRTGLRGGVHANLTKFKRPSARSCTWVRAIPSTNTGWAASGLITALSRRTLGCWLVRSSAWSSNVHSQTRRPTISQAA